MVIYIDPKKFSQTHIFHTDRLKYTFFNKLANSSLSPVTILPCLAALTLTAAPLDSPSLAPGSPCSSIKFHHTHKNFLCSPFFMSLHPPPRIMTTQSGPQVKLSLLSPLLKGTARLHSPQILTLSKLSGKSQRLSYREEKGEFRMQKREGLAFLCSDSWNTGIVFFLSLSCVLALPGQHFCN